jgi:DNA-binding transcriptional regulator YiaG
MATPAETKTAIGDEIRRLRDALGMTLQDFGRHVGVPWQTIQAYETGRVMPPADRLFKIVHACRRAKEPFRFEHVARAVGTAVLRAA